LGTANNNAMAHWGYCVGGARGVTGKGKGTFGQESQGARERISIPIEPPAGT
jgi:hypothetical protein